MESDPNKLHLECPIHENDSNSKTQCYLEFFQRKYKCFIIYAIIFLSLCEFLYIILSPNSGDVDYLQMLGKLLNRTQSMKLAR